MLSNRVAAATLATLVALARPAGAEIVINEVDYDNVGFDNAEFIELVNNGPDPIDLINYEVDLVDGSTVPATVYKAIALPDVVLRRTQCFVICGNSATVANCDLQVTPSTNLIQNGNPDAIAVVNTALNMIVDTVSYGGDTAPPYTEGSGVGLMDSNTVPGSISRFPDGNDTNMNNQDFRFTSPPTPGECGTVSVGDFGGTLTYLAAPYPNPFQEHVAVRFSLPRTDRVSLRVHDLRGRVVRVLVDEETDPGEHTVMWDGLDDHGSPVPAGMYFVRFVHSGGTMVQRVLRIR